MTHETLGVGEEARRVPFDVDDISEVFPGEKIFGAYGLKILSQPSFKEIGVGGKN